MPSAAAPGTGRGDLVERRLSAFLAKHGQRGVPILIAYSGGSDSTALLLAAAAVAPGLGVLLHAAWVDHGIRPAPERARERDFVENLTSRLGVHSMMVEPPEEPLETRAARLGLSVEAEARAFRYVALTSAARSFGCERILTAHTRDDQAETLLQRILSGSGAAGLRGIPEDRPPFLRPFLSLPKRELLRYLRERGVAWTEDSTNEGETYLRNRIRLQVIPVLEQVFPGFRKGLSSLAEKSRFDEELLTALAARELPVSIEANGISFDAACFRAAHPALRIRALLAGTGALAGNGRRVPYALVRSVALSIRKPAAGSVPRLLAEGMGLRFLEDAGRIHVVAAGPATDAAPGSRNGAGPIRPVTFAAGYSFLFERPGTLRIDSGASCTVYFREDGNGPAAGTFDFPLTVRSRRPGDRLAVQGGEKRLDEILAALSIARELRDFVPILEDGRGVVGILGSAAGSRDRYRQGPDSLDPSLPRLCVEIAGIGPFR